MADPLNVQFELSGNTGIITIQGPQGNVLSQPDFVPASQIADWAERPEINGLIITGAGRNFSSGAEVENLFKMASEKDFLMQKMKDGKETLNTLENLNIPVMAVVSGVCFGGGLEIALACHFRVCSENALFAFPEINLQLIPGLGGSVRLHEIVGASAALGILLSGDTIGAEEALRMGLVDHCKAKPELMAFAKDLMARMVHGRPKKVVQSVMQSWHNSRNMSFHQALQEETRLFYELAKDELYRRSHNSE